MNWSRVEQLLASCDKQVSAGARTDLALGDYRDVFARYDGIEGFVGREQYVQLWKAADIAKLNTAYQVDDYAPGLMLFGTDGGDTGYGIDGVTKRYVSVPLVGLSREAFRDVGGTFEEFLEKLADE
jgi:hypothetical protein